MMMSLMTRQHGEEIEQISSISNVDAMGCMNRERLLQYQKTGSLLSSCGTSVQQTN